MVAHFSIIGKKGSGRSEVLEQLVLLLKQKGYRVGVIKHLAKDDIEIDQPEKDTYRYRMQGAETVMLAGRKRLAVFSNLNEEIPLNQLLHLFEDFDVVLLEGYMQNDIYKFEVYQPLSMPQLEEFVTIIEEKIFLQKKATCVS
jgi:molybdopterin-guanine dinucleotide biosynthesis adapter protein